MVAPRMIGEGLRIWYEKGTGFCSFVAVEQDYTGQAQEIVLALAKGIGGASPAMFTTFEEEAVIDLFGEQVGGGGALVGTLTQFETLLEAGFDPEIIQIEMYGSGELIEVQRSVTEMGLVEALSLHSPTSQYGQLKRRKQFTSQAMKDLYKSVLSEIKSGAFAEEWEKEQESGYQNMEQMRTELNNHPIINAEKANMDVRDHMFGKKK
jgi:ketol-acid reductoisomerase